MIKLMGLGGSGMFLVLTILTATGQSNSLGTTIGDASLFGLLGALLLLAATTSVCTDGQDLVLVRLLAVTRLPLANIKSASGDNGLEIVMADGQTYTHFGYGSSLLGSLTGNRRSTGVAKAIQGAIAQGSAPADMQPVVVRPRFGLGWFVVLPPTFVVIASLVHG